MIMINLDTSMHIVLTIDIKEAIEKLQAKISLIYTLQTLFKLS